MTREEQEMVREYKALKAKQNDVEFSFYSKYARQLVDAIKQDKEIASLIYTGNESIKLFLKGNLSWLFVNLKNQKIL